MVTAADYAGEGQHDRERGRMAEDWLYKEGGFGTLRVRFVFIPEVASAPAEWLADHPNHIRVPATFVPRASSPARQAEVARRGPATSDGSASPMRSEGTVTGSRAPIGPDRRRRFPPPPQIDRTRYFKERPVAAYLRANKAFGNLGGRSQYDEAGRAGSVDSDLSELRAPTRFANPEPKNQLKILATSHTLVQTPETASGRQTQANELQLADSTRAVAASANSNVINVGYFTTDAREAAQGLGMSSREFRAAIHAPKDAAGLGGADDVVIHVPSGEVFFNGENVGNLRDE